MEQNNVASVAEIIRHYTEKRCSCPIWKKLYE